MTLNPGEGENGGEEGQGKDINVELWKELWPELDCAESVPFLFCESHSQAGSASQNLTLKPLEPLERWRVGERQSSGIKVKLWISQPEPDIETSREVKTGELERGRAEALKSTQRSSLFPPPLPSLIPNENTIHRIALHCKDKTTNQNKQLLEEA